MKPLLAFGAALLVALLLPLAEIGNQDEAERIVTTYLNEVVSGDGDRGWSLLRPETQKQVFGSDRDGYVDVADESDWAQFTWSILYVLRDEPFNYEVAIEYQGELPGSSQPLPTSKTALVQRPRHSGCSSITHCSSSQETESIKSRLRDHR